MVALVVSFSAAQTDLAYLRRGAFPLDAGVYPRNEKKWPEHCDLGVTHVERLPRYRAYQVEYTYEGCGANNPRVAKGYDVKHWPDAGEQVTYVAHVRNHGGRASPAFVLRWSVDGVETAREAVGGLAAGVEYMARWETAWSGRSHVIEVAAVPDEPADEIATFNNRYQFDPLAINLVWATTPTARTRLSSVRNHLGNFSYEDWINYYLDFMNLQWATNRYPIAPNGTRARIRIDRWIELPDQAAYDALVAADGPPQAWGLDGAWQQMWTLEEFEGPRRDELMGYVTRWDWGLPHELGHQCGLIDEYQLDYEAVHNLVSGAGGLPLKIGHNCRVLNSMMHGHADVPFGDVAIAALEAQVGRRRGFYGDYLFALPEHVSIRLLDNRGAPAACANLTFYQPDEQRRLREVFRAGSSDGAGRVELPNRPIDIPPYTTDAGFAYHDNPFGRIDIVGGSAVLFVEIESRGHREYRWLELLELNRLYFLGQRAHGELVWRTHIPHAALPAAPEQLRARRAREGEGLELSWSPRGDTSTVAYQVYRGEPATAELHALARTERWEPRFVDRTAQRGRLYRYAVTALDAALNESGFSNQFAFGPLGEPGGMAFLPPAALGPADAGGELLVVADHAQNQLQILGGDGQVIGPLNTVHAHLYPHDVAVGPDGLLAATDLPDGYNGEARVALFGPRDAYINPLLVLRREELGAHGPLKDPHGICFDGQDALWVADTGNRRVLRLELQRGDDAASDRRATPQNAAPTGFRVGGVIASSSAAALESPVKVAAGAGRLFVCDAARKCVLEYDTRSGEARVVRAYDDLVGPAAVAVDADGRLFVSDAGDGCVRVYAADGRAFSRKALPDGGRPSALALRGAELHVLDEVSGCVIGLRWKP
ncbi:MAG: hypothetical protein CHACPFDD_00089 [Phycisphaerae bacterium]|nr:hypothetical protein [Phycisphaerae bacterium]